MMLGAAGVLAVTAALTVGLWPGAARSGTRYGLGEATRPLSRVNDAFPVQPQMLPGFSFRPNGVSVPAFRYEWTHAENGSKGEFLLAVCGDRETAEYVWQTHLSGYAKLTPSSIVSGQAARHGDIELDLGVSVVFLRNNVFCCITGTDGRSQASLTTAVHRLASGLVETLSRTDKPAEQAAFGAEIEKFTAGSLSSPKGVGLPLILHVRVGSGPKPDVQYASVGGRIDLNKDGNAIFAADRAGDYQVRVLVFLARSVLLSKTLKITVTD